MLRLMPKRHTNQEGPQATSATLAQVGARLRAIRKFSGQPQTALCRILGVDQSTWSKWEQGLRLPDIFMMIRFAARTKVTLDLIYRGNPDGIHPHLRGLLERDYPDLLVSRPIDMGPDTDTALASYRAAIDLTHPSQQDDLCGAS